MFTFFETIQTRQYGEIRLGWIRLLYSCTAFLGITVGSTMLIAPDFSRSVVGYPHQLPVQDPITYGALGGIWTTVGIICLMGLRAPLQFLPMFTLQLVYKGFWFTFIFFPLILTDQFPNHGWASVVGNLIWILMDLKSIPWKYLLATNKTGDLDVLRAESKEIEAEQAAPEGQGYASPGVGASPAS